MADATPAATLIIVRDLPQGHEILMIERHTHLAFAGGAQVFPGGRIDEDDRTIATADELSLAGSVTDQDDAAARVAAIRESLEETGVAIGIPGLSPPHLHEWRERLLAGERLSALLHHAGTRLELDRLTPFARWQPMRNEQVSRIFDTRFYLARAPEQAEIPAEADGMETTHIFWSTPQQVIAQADAGRGIIIFPTRRNLERLASHSGYAALKAHAESINVTKIQPWIEEADGKTWLTIPDNLGYPVTRQLLDTVVRG